MSANRSCLCAFTFAEHEYINAFGTNYWRRTIRASFAQPMPAPPPSATAACPTPDLLPTATPSSK